MYITVLVNVGLIVQKIDLPSRECACQDNV